MAPEVLVQPGKLLERNAVQDLRHRPRSRAGDRSAPILDEGENVIQRARLTDLRQAFQAGDDRLPVTKRLHQG